MAAPRRYALAIQPGRCIDCKACVVACRAEHSVPVGYQRNWIEEEVRGEFPRLAAEFRPEQCHHCDEPACVRVCPTGASRKRADGVVVVDEADCVGCRYCVLACPYEARFFREDKGVVEKCDLCAHRLDAGRIPACVETCPGKVRVAGDLNDAGGRLRRLLDARPHRVSMPEAGTEPRLFYVG